MKYVLIMATMLAVSLPLNCLSAESDQELRVIQPEAYIKIEEALQQSLDFEIKNLALQEVLIQLADELNIPIWLDQPSLDLAGISASTPCTLALPKVTVRSALRLLLDPMELTYTYTGEVLHVCTKQDALSHQYSLVYGFPSEYEREDVNALLTELAKRGTKKNQQQPIVKILRIVNSEEREFHLYVEANEFVHRRIREVLELLGKASRHTNQTPDETGQD